ncbi:hypothetical protein BJY00DRAFT_143186 [Aspergillus carlsbadensis]|nr:hypothetical protein BJY00DRAFT_143186 [Aspergillus carlsbadensis]
MLLIRTVGPLDKRRKVKRCLACAHRRIKCEGGIPCRYCARKATPCVPQQQVDGKVVFVQQRQPSKRETACLTNVVKRDQSTQYLNAFVSFIQQNAFTANLSVIILDLLPLIPTSPVLRHAAMAVGALHAKRNSVEREPIGRKSSPLAAINSYHLSMVALQACLGDDDVMQRDDVLWATFFLGLFELLSDHSGEGWVKHMLYGTSKMLQLAGPGSCMSPLRRPFYDLFRVLEASRSLLYNEETILSQDCWIRFQRAGGSDITTRWEPMEEIITLMILTSAFSLRASSHSESFPEPGLYTNPSTAFFATEGLKIQAALYNWHTDALLKLTQGGLNEDLDLSLIYYHALLIFLSGNFDYFPSWNNIPGPVLSPADVSDHLIAILDLAEQILSQARIPGVMLFFPLTVAGSRARDPVQRSQILSLLDQVFCRGFVVASRVRDGMLNRWIERDSMLLSDQVRNTVEVGAAVVYN